MKASNKIFCHTMYIISSIFFCSFSYSAPTAETLNEISRGKITKEKKIKINHNWKESAKQKYSSITSSATYDVILSGNPYTVSVFTDSQGNVIEGEYIEDKNYRYGLGLDEDGNIKNRGENTILAGKERPPTGDFGTTPLIEDGYAGALGLLKQVIKKSPSLNNLSAKNIKNIQFTTPRHELYTIKYGLK